jgi:UDP-N-acetylmuramate dehydrogenase
MYKRLIISGLMKTVSNYPIRNTFRMKVKCALYVEIESEEELAAMDFGALPQPVMVMGGGSNLLFTKDFPGTVLHISSPSPYPCPGVDTSAGGCFVTLPAGTVFDDFCAWAAAEGLWGPENLSLIPGECGASAVQNIGAYGVEAKDIIVGIRAWDRLEGRFVHIGPATCAYGYRTSKFKTEWKGRYIITAVTYRLSREPQPRLDYGGLRKALEASGVRVTPPGDSASLRSAPAPPTGFASGPLPLHLSGGGQAPGGVTLTPQIIRQTIIDIRNAKLPDPAVTGSAGSFFCNPVISKEHFERIKDIARQDNGPDYQVPHYEVGDQIKVPAAWMIEQCGFKGKRLGGAQVYQNQPLVIVNASGEASPEEIIGLETEVIQAIESKYGITLHPEVEHI